ncbi:hypothetical protein ES702_05294 [subsurface metagenome]
MWEKIANYKVIIISLISVIVAIVIVTLAEKYLAVGTLRIVILDISSAVLVIAVIGVIFDLFLRKEMINLVVERAHLSWAVIQTGLKSIRIGRDYLDLKRRVNESRKAVCFLGVTSHTPIISCRNEIRDVLTKYRVEVNILVCEEESSGIKEREGEEGAEGIFSKEILDVVRLLQDIVSEIELGSERGIYKKKEFGKVEIRQYSRLPFCSLYIFDWKECLYIPYLFKIRGANCPVFNFLLSKGGDSVFILLKAHYENLWDDAKGNIAFSWPSQGENSSIS